MARPRVAYANSKKCLSEVRYPVSKENLISRLREEGADEDIIATIEHVDAERFTSPADVNEALTITDEMEQYQSINKRYRTL